MNYDSILSERVKELRPSGIRRFFDILEEMKDAISLGVGEPDFVTPWHIRDAGIYSLEKGFTKYTSNAGMAGLRRDIASYLERRFDLKYDFATQMIVTVGGSEAIDMTMRALLNPGDEVIIPVPSFVCYAPLAQMTGAKAVLAETRVEDEFKLTPELLKSCLTPKTKLVVVPFPNNPTGGIMEKADYEALAEVLRGTGVMLLSDEIYAELTYGQHHFSPANLPELYDRTVVVNGFSKSHAMTGWRMGYVCGPAPIIKQMLKLHQFGIMSAPTTSQYAAIEAMQNGDRDIEKMRDEYDGRRRYLVEGLRRIGLPCHEPRGAFYVFPDIRGTGLSSDEFCERFLMEEKVAVISGAAFGPGGEGFVRCCYATSMKDIAEALTRLDNFLTNLKKKQGRGEA
ncbi:MAG: pyridoxal phosphate-dependent aminotransferase [Oscillospiraceae bacterium]|uniref:pyridoxal phosphate-dependent aminotransferase n=1 Tax=Candidatus Pseudoscillospira sp. SGI.172 TaxID=3420582 RepID=UPI0009BC0F6D|nr:aminotransferase class I/II-fold pyridoxal phosphate-dependent enzyme [Pseudoflavonifractor sp.]MDY3019468.1 aminotransferase class I/II-fold pyridoxal phosphate-dependent enzyme [Oscillospiraceae bacterium]